MIKLTRPAAAIAAVLAATPAAYAQGMMLDYAASRVIEKYTKSTCEELKAMRDKPQSEKEKLALDFLRGDDQARKAFIDKIAPAVANKMFECGMFP